mgnify:CR=1 FL=1
MVGNCRYDRWHCTACRWEDTATGNRKIKNITIKQANDLLMLEGKLQSAINEALEKSDNVMQAEMLNVTKGMMPPGMG